jgi:hypothetical protein
MPYEYAGNTIPAPTVGAIGPFSYDQELKYSAIGFSQKGGVLKGGQGILPLGTVLARDTQTKQWVKFVSGGANGAGVAAGILRKTTDTGAAGDGRFQSNIVFRGSLKYNLVSSANGAQLAAAITALSANANPTLNVFTF